MRDYQSLQKDSQSLKNPARILFEKDFEVRKATDTCTGKAQVDHRVS